MKITRVLFPALIVMAWPLWGIDVKRFGAIGDGIADDSAAIGKAVSCLKAEGGGVLDFPKGIYRIGSLQGGPVFAGISNIKINFASGAILLMDNLDQNGNGGGHGFTFRAPAENIELHNVNIVWKNRPRRRSMGDGIRFEGFPEENKTIRKILIDNCRVDGSAQTGAVLMGCSDIIVKNFTVENSWADGLHFNACRNITVDGVNGVHTGDDTLAFVTYFSPEFSGKIGTVFALPDLEIWNNSNTIVRRVRVIGGRANGIRIAGARNLRISDVEVTGKSCGIIIDAGLAGPKHRWQYFASRDIKIKNARLMECDTGFYVWQFNSSLDNPNFSQFGVICEEFMISGCKNDSVHLSGVSGVEIKKFSTTGCRWRFRTFRNCSVKNITIAGAPFLVIGNDTKVNPSELHKISANDSEFELINIHNGRLEIQKCRGIKFHNVAINNSPAEAILLYLTLDGDLSNVKISGVNSENKARVFACRLLQSQSLDWKNVDVAAAHPLVAVFEIGGGTAQLRSGNIVIQELNAPKLKPVMMQGGRYAPKNCFVQSATIKRN